MKSKPTNTESYPILCPEDLFRYFIRKLYNDIEISNKQCNIIRIEFSKYLNQLNLTDEQKKKILPKNEIDVIMNTEHPFRINGFPAAYVFHFIKFIEKEKEKILND